MPCSSARLCFLHSSCRPRMWQSTALGTPGGPRGCGRPQLGSEACMPALFAQLDCNNVANALAHGVQQMNRLIQEEHPCLYNRKYQSKKLLYDCCPKTSQHQEILRNHMLRA